MRRVVMLQPETSTITSDDIKRRVDEIIVLFDAYLEEYPVKSARSKHAIMGPVAKVLERAETGQWRAEPLAGYALRMHEMNPRTGGRISSAAASKLLDGTEKLLALCQEVPVTELARTVEQIDYGLYFQRRVKGLQWMEAQRAELIQFLHQKYPSDEAFAQAWRQKKGARIDDLYSYFTASSKTYRAGTEALRADMDEFYALMKRKGESPEAILEDESEA